MEEIAELEKLIAEKKQALENERVEELEGETFLVNGINFKIAKYHQKRKNRDGTSKGYDQLYARGFEEGKNYKIHISKKIRTKKAVKEHITKYLTQKNNEKKEEIS